MKPVRIDLSLQRGETAAKRVEESVELTSTKCSTLRGRPNPGKWNSERGAKSAGAPPSNLVAPGLASEIWDFADSEEVLQIPSSVHDSHDFYPINAALIAIGIGFVKDEVGPFGEYACR